MSDIIEARITSSDTGNLMGVGRGSDPLKAIRNALASKRFAGEADSGRCGEYVIETYGVEADQVLGCGVEVEDDVIGGTQ